MKKISSIAIVILLGMTSCKKSATVSETSQSVDVTLDANTAYEYDLGKAQSISIDSEASHARISVITKDPVSAKTTYYYVPDSNYVGTDNVTVVVTSGQNPDCSNPNAGAPGGNCKKPKTGCKNKPADDVVKTTYTFKFVVGNKVQN